LWQASSLGGWLLHFLFPLLPPLQRQQLLLLAAVLVVVAWQLMLKVGERAYCQQQHWTQRQRRQQLLQQQQQGPSWTPACGQAPSAAAAAQASQAVARPALPAAAAVDGAGFLAGHHHQAAPQPLALPLHLLLLLLLPLLLLKGWQAPAVCSSSRAQGCWLCPHNPSHHLNPDQQHPFHLLLLWHPQHPLLAPTQQQQWQRRQQRQCGLHHGLCLLLHAPA
jgi:hypothetical protein